MKVEWHIYKRYVCGCRIEESKKDMMHSYIGDRVPFLVQCKEHGGGFTMWYPDGPGKVWIPKHLEQERDEELAQLTGLA